MIQNQRSGLPLERWKNFAASDIFAQMITYLDESIAKEVDRYASDNFTEEMDEKEFRAYIKGMKRMRSRLRAKVLNSAQLGSPALGKAGFAHRHRSI